MNESAVCTTTVTLHAPELTPAFHVQHIDGEFCVSLTNWTERGGIYIDGSLDELAKFVQDLANVVQEINARELAATS